MLFISVEDFFRQAGAITPLDRGQEKELALAMRKSDQTARQALIFGYLPFVASAIRKAPKNIQTLHTVYACIETLEKCVDRFDFQQDSERFTHHLSWGLRQCITRCIADRP